MSNENNNLSLYGWSDNLFRQKQISQYKDMSHGRIIVTHKTCYEVVAEDGVYLCELTGNMIYGRVPDEYPCTGDWVIFQPFDANKGIIVDILPRERALYRKKNGRVADRQAIASYVDKAFIVQSLDDNFNVRRAERFIAQVMEEKIKHIARQFPVFITSIRQPQTILRLRESITKGETVVFVGSSGVGKSSLVNALCGKSVLNTSDISLSTGKGRHTSTRREMVLMDGSGVLIDTPGVREFGLAIDNPDSLTEMFEISDYAESCRFSDCKHIDEPGCAVLEAVHNGTLDHKVYESYLKLKREAWHFSASEHEKRKKEKSFTKLVEEVKKRKANF